MIYDGFNNNHIPHANLAQSIPTDWIDSLCTSLLHINPLTQHLMSLHDLCQNFPHSKASSIIKDSGCQEITAIMCYDNTTQHDVQPRSLIITSTLGSSQWIPTISHLWEPLAYPVFFPSGILGWGISNELSNVDGNISHDSSVPTSQIWHYQAHLLREDRFSIFGRLMNKYVVDMFSCDLECRMHYIQSNQLCIRAEEDSALMDLEDISNSDNIYLPSSFLSSS
jgi:hypothetical protein